VRKKKASEWFVSTCIKRIKLGMNVLWLGVQQEDPKAESASALVW
jgi:hypothetical protein